MQNTNTYNILLYSFRRCPYAMRARMALSYSKIKWEHREILLKNKPKSMLEFSSKGTVPVLVVGTKVIDESLDVMKWALSQKDAENWMLSTDNSLQEKMYKLIKLCDDDFKTQLDNYKYSDFRPLSELEYREGSLWFLQMLDDLLSKQAYLIHDKISLADIAIFPFIRQYAYVNKKWFDETNYVYLQNWLEKWLKSDLFLSIMQKHALWEDI